MYADGRWHSKGRLIVYAGEHPALALVETLAHLNLDIEEVPDTLKLCRITLADDLTVFRCPLPVGWQANELMSRKAGDGWLAAGEHPLFEVPSAILPHSTNVLINPAHPAVAAGVHEVSVEDLWIDARFLR